MTDSHIFRVEVLEGRGFGVKVDALRLAVTFAGETKITPYSIGVGSHTWECKLQWSVTTAQLRRLSANGQNVCKVVVYDREGAHAGWLVLDLRSAKLNYQYHKDKGGVWSALSGARKNESPQLRLTCELIAERLLAKASTGTEEQQTQPEKQSKSSSSASAAAVAERPKGQKQAGKSSITTIMEEAEVPEEQAYEDDFEDAVSAGSGGDAAGIICSQPATNAEFSGHSLQQQQVVLTPQCEASVNGCGSGGGSGEADNAAATAQPAILATASQPARPDQQCVTAPLAAPPPAAVPVDPLARLFALTVDMRSFQGAKKLPLNLASVYVLAVLPPSIIDLVVRSGHRVPPKMAPMKTHPAVEVARGAESALPNGHGTVEFVAGVMELAHSLAQEPRMTVEVWHKEKFRSDSLLGVASVPLSPLLQDAWVDGYAPVYALMGVNSAGEEAAQLTEKVQVGMLHMVLALEEKGPAHLAAQSQADASLAPPSRAQAQPTPGAPVLMAPRISTGAHVSPGSAPLALTGAAAAVPSANGQQQQAQQQQQQQQVFAQPSHDLPAFEAAYELEVWKKAEEARWRAEVREREAQRMALLEAEWRRRERAREVEMAAVRSEYSALEERTREVLLAAEERERRLVAAEETLARRRRDLEREHATRMDEAEAAVRRLQVECGHQLEIERDRNTELVRQRNALEERLAVADTRGVALERAFADFREEARAAPPARQAAELIEVREALQRAEERVSRAIRAKAAYKVQVVKLAEQLAALYQQQQRSERLGLESRRADRDASALRLAAETEARYSLTQQQQLALLRQQLQVLKNSALSAVSPSGSPTRAHRHVPGDASTNSMGGDGRDASGAAAAAAAAVAAAPPQVIAKTGAGDRARGTPSWEDTYTCDQHRAGLEPALATPTAPSEGKMQQQQPPATEQQPRQQRPDAMEGPKSQHMPLSAPPSSASLPAPTSSCDQPLHHSMQQQQQQSNLNVAAAATSTGATSPMKAASPAGPLAEIRRLQLRKTELLRTGAYRHNDPLLLKIDQRVTELAAGSKQG